MKTTNALQILALAIFCATATEACAYFDPTIGRWASRDPIGEKGGRNLLVIAKNDIVNHIDALGLMKWECMRWVRWRTRTCRAVFSRRPNGTPH